MVSMGPSDAETTAAMDKYESEEPVVEQQTAADATENDGNATSAAASPQSASSPTSPGAAALRAQMDFYFSPANLARDAYLISRADAEGYVLLDVLAGFKKVQALAAGPADIAAAVADSAVCELREDGLALRDRAGLAKAAAAEAAAAAARRPARTTVILREVEEETSEEEVLALFKDEGLEAVSARRDVAQTWFVAMASEDQAKSAVLRLIGKELRGLPVKARLKSEAARPAGSGAGVAPPPMPPALAASGFYAYTPGAFADYGPLGWQPAAAYMQQQQTEGTRQVRSMSARLAEAPLSINASRQAAFPPSGPQSARGPGDRRRGLSTGAKTPTHSTAPQQQQQQRRRPSAHTGSRSPGAAAAKPEPVPVFDAGDFPELSVSGNNSKVPAASAAASNGGDDDDGAGSDAASSVSSRHARETTTGDGKKDESAGSSTGTSESEQTPPVAAPRGSWAAAVVARSPRSGDSVTSSRAPSPQEEPASKPAGACTETEGEAERPRKTKEVETRATPKTEPDLKPEQQQEQHEDEHLDDRPRRGWERPEFIRRAAPAPAKSESPSSQQQQQKEKATQGISGEGAASVKSESSETTATTNTTTITEQHDKSIADKAALKNAFGVWGQQHGSKKTFADVIRSAGAPAATSATTTGTKVGPPAPSSSKGTSERPSLGNKLSAAAAAATAAASGAAAAAPSSSSSKGDWRAASSE